MMWLYVIFKYWCVYLICVTHTLFSHWACVACVEALWPLCRLHQFLQGLWGVSLDQAGASGVSLSGWNLWGLGDLWRTAVYFIGKMQDSSLRSDWVDCNV